MVDPIILALAGAGPRPKRPARPRRPKEFIRKTECVWSSDDASTLLSNILHLVPGDVRAEDVHVSVGAAGAVSITYDYDVPNTRFHDQMHEYAGRMRQFETDMVEWRLRDAAWHRDRDALEEELRRLSDGLLSAFDDADAPGAGAGW